ncbi:MAG: sugar phosphate isomerase/epimerase family protein [Planctomycetota bacterium]
MSSAPVNRYMGVCTASYGHRLRNDSEKYPRFQNSLDMMRHCHTIGAAGVQVGVRGWQGDMAGKVRDLREDFGMYLEGQIRLPQNRGDVDRFESEVRGAVEAGATILRTAMLGGRRYETFDSAEAFATFKKKSWQSLTLAEPIASKHGVTIAIENHKDWRIAELLDILRRIDSERVGVTVDTGNSVSLMEAPMDTVKAFAPYAKSVHLKDMGVQEYSDGFLLSELPLGDGFLDLKGVVDVLLKANPSIKFSLEMITRDPLRVPCLTDKYWATLGGLGGVELARTLKMVRHNVPEKALPRVGGMSADERVQFENDNVVQSFAYTKRVLGW